MLSSSGRLLRIPRVPPHRCRQWTVPSSVARPQGPAARRSSTASATKDDENHCHKSSKRIKTTPTAADADNKDDAPTGPKHAPTQDIGIGGDRPHNSVPALNRRRARASSHALPARVVRPSRHHDDLASFLAHAERARLDPATAVYKGTRYEYEAAEALAGFDFSLHRTGRANDRGVDLLGHWDLPGAGRARGQTLRVLAQCKAGKAVPAMVRELEGAYAGAPAGWGGEDVLALLVARQPATRGVLDAMRRSRWPLGVVQVAWDGTVGQFAWNGAAARIGLEGLGVAVRFADGEAKDVSSSDGDLEDGKHGRVRASLTLTWMGKVWRTVGGAKSS